MCSKRGIKATVIGYKRVFTNQTAKKILIKDAPIKKDSAITNEPGNAYVKKVEKILCSRLKPIFFRRAPIAIKLAPNAKAGLSKPLIDLNPLKKIFRIYHYPPRNNLPTSGFFNRSFPFPAIAVCPETKT